MKIASKNNFLGFFMILALVSLSACTNQPSSPSVNTNQNGENTIRNVNILPSVEPQSIKTQEVTYFNNVKGFYAAPEKAGTYPGVVMIHEWLGLNDYIKEMAEKLAQEGYQVLAVDLYNGAVAQNPDQARQLRDKVNQEEATKNLQSAVDYLKTQKATKIASWGWCFGGGQSLQLSTSGIKLDGTIVYYGTPITDTQKLANITWPVLGVFGDKDTSIPVDQVKAFEKALQDQKINSTVHIYPNVGHAFANPSGANFSETETKDAWLKTLSFLQQTLKQPSQPAVNSNENATTTSNVKEFTMGSYHEMVNGEMMPKFSLKEMRVKKGDTVRIKIKNTAGRHDIKIDEFNVFAETPLNEEIVVEFTADKAGEFVYYCSKPTHREKGQWGTLYVTE